VCWHNETQSSKYGFPPRIIQIFEKTNLAAASIKMLKLDSARIELLVLTGLYFYATCEGSSRKMSVINFID